MIDDDDAHHLPEFAGGLDGLAERPRVGLRVEDVRDEGVLRRVHDERAVRHVLADAEERQEPGKEEEGASRPQLSPKSKLLLVKVKMRMKT